MQIAVKPQILKDVILTIGTTDTYEKHVSQVLFTPTSSQITWQGLTPEAAFSDTATATWACQLDYVQDWETPNSLSRFLYENEGETVPVTFKPIRGSGPEWAATLIIVPGAVGGAVNAFSTTSVTLGASGRPTLVDPSAPTAWAATTAYAVGDRVTVDSGAARLRALTAGTSDAAEPVAPAVGSVVIDGTVAWLRA